MLPVNMNLILITGANLFLNNQHDADEEHHTVDVNYDSGAEDGETGVNDEIDTAEVDCAWPTLDDVLHGYTTDENYNRVDMDCEEEW